MTDNNAASVQKFVDRELRGRHHTEVSDRRSGAVSLRESENGDHPRWEVCTGKWSGEDDREPPASHRSGKPVQNAFAEMSRFYPRQPSNNLVGSARQIGAKLEQMRIPRKGNKLGISSAGRVRRAGEGD